MSALLECVPNVSEGRDPEKISLLAEAIQSVSQVKLLHVDSGHAAHRTVFTFVGEPEKVVDAAFHLYKKAAQILDMRNHHGTHPRQGAVDVCPLIPIQNISMEETVALSRKLAQRIENELNIAGWFYEKSALSNEKCNLAFLRKGEYESLPEKFQSLPPDFGSAENWQQFGATVIGARKFLIAYNVNLATKDVEIAKKIATGIREKGKPDRPHFLPTVKAIGWYLEDFDKVQVSCNLTDYERVGMVEVFETVQKLAREMGTEVTGSEVVGMVPRAAITSPPAPLLKERGDAVEKAAHIKKWVKKLGLDELRPFVAEEKIIELAGPPIPQVRD